MRRSRVIRAIAALSLAAVLAALVAGPAVAIEPIDVREPGVRPVPPRVIEPQPSAPPIVSATPEPLPEYGIDVSYPQCGDELPDAFAFAIVGVNGGRVHAPNPCLAADGDAPSQLEWAGRDVELYANTANPGPRLSSFWPDGQVEPRACLEEGLLSTTDTHDCAYLYGWNAAAASYRTALEAFISLGWADDDADRLPWETTWWLDVETANSWRGDRSLNVATLRGAVDYLESMDVAEVGFYSTPLLWWRVTRGTDAFEDYPAWHAGAGTQARARDRCDGEGFTGGELRMQQWVQNGIDTNYRCP
jgi:hypothetical protein